MNDFPIVLFRCVTRPLALSRFSRVMMAPCVMGRRRQALSNFACRRRPTAMETGQDIHFGIGEFCVTAHAMLVAKNSLIRRLLE